ncbi:L,D-transpeptidase [Terrarubrum flagellatum]|uniref:L,D-transpeptidase n=1 Tax=Terrirubrum flagellatum TaxID=2895980 RepID=UPI0031453EC9
MRRAIAFASVIIGLLAAPLAAQARVDIRVDLSSQSMQVTAPDGSVRNWAISSGRKGFRTPTGSYSSQRLARMHYSKKYDDAPMPHSIFFRGGYAIHATNATRLLGRPASHGCIRLAPGNAAQLFAMVKEYGARISIGGAAPGDGVVRTARRAAPARPMQEPVATSMAPQPNMSRGVVAPIGFRDAPRSVWSIDGAGPAPQFILR